MSISWFLKEIDPIYKIFKNSHFMFSGRYSSHIQDFQEFIEQIVRIRRPPSFATFTTLWGSKMLIFAKIMFPKNDSGFSLNYFGYLGVSEVGRAGVGVGMLRGDA